MTEKPTITIAICVKDGEKYLAEAIESAQRQSRPPVQVLVIDDDSSDTTCQIAADFGCDVVQQSRKGLGVGRNTAFAEAKGDYVFFLDSDDVMLDDCLSELMDALIATPGAVGACGFRENFLSPELAQAEAAEDTKRLERNRGPLSSGALWRRDLGSAVSFNEDSPVTDIEWGLNLVDQGYIIAESDETVIRRRVHLTNQSAREDVRREYLTLAIKRRKNALNT